MAGCPLSGTLPSLRDAGFHIGVSPEKGGVLRTSWAQVRVHLVSSGLGLAMVLAPFTVLNGQGLAQSPSHAPSTLPTQLVAAPVTTTTVHHPPTTIHHTTTTIHHAPTTIHHAVTTIHHVPTTIHHAVTTIHHPTTTIRHALPTVRHTTTTHHTTTTVRHLNPSTTTTSTTTPPTTTTSTDPGETTTTTTPPVTTTTKPAPKPKPRFKIGIATWYRWRPGQCATSYLPKGTHIKIRSLRTGRTVYCVVTDSQPYSKNRVVDLAVPQFSRLAPLARGVEHVIVTW